LKVSKNANSLTCQFCGNEHMVKHEPGGAVMLEAYARCPICGRNDRAEKVSAVIASQSHEISGVEQKSEVITNAQGQKQTVVRDVPFTRRQVSVLGQRLVAPPPPDPSRFLPFPAAPKRPSVGGGVAAIVFGVLGVLVSLGIGIASISSFFASVSSASNSESSSLAMTGLVLVVLAIAILIGGFGLVGLGIFLSVRAKRPDSNAARYQEQVEAVKREHARIQRDYERALARWKDLYYCARDDCVFVLGENSSAPVARMNEYLAQLPPNPPPS
jgi:hypothetical protein